MKNLNFLISVFLLVLSFSIFNSSFVEAANPTQRNEIAYVSSSNQEAGPQNIRCVPKYSDLNYVGIKFDGEAICIEAQNDSEAISKCSGMKIINPGNPQYQDTISGSRDQNPSGFYYCVPNISRNSKEFACRVVAPRESTYKNTVPQVEFRWQRLGGSRDGECLCGLRGAEPSLRCDRSLPQFPDECAPMGLQRATQQEYLSMMRDPRNAGTSFGPMACKCADGRIFDSRLARQRCSEASGGQTASDVLDPDLKQCVDDWKAAANKCKTTSEEAKDDCRSDDSDRYANSDTQGALNAANRAFIMSKSGSGAQQECFKGSLAANYAKKLLKEKSESCSSNSGACTEACNESEINTHKNNCQNILLRLQQQTQQPGGQAVNQNSRYFTEGEQLANRLVSRGSSICESISTDDQLTISKDLKIVGDSLSASMICMCRLSNGTGTNCDKIASPSSCEMDPTLPGCRQYGAINVCTPGTGYDAKICSCQTNPKGVGCPGGAGSGGLVGFASGANINNYTAVNDAGFGSSAINLKPSAEVDLSGAYAEPIVASNLKLEDSKSATAGASSGSAGGGTNSGEGGSAPGAMFAEEESSKLSGLFNQAKSFMSNAFGLKKTGPNGNLEPVKKSIDVNKFRPIRGLASKYPVGTKHMDIWKMVNTCLYAETCGSNSNSFLDSPLKHK